ncbi:MAG: TIGR02996 domain-containing protein [Archangium sp.]
MSVHLDTARVALSESRNADALNALLLAWNTHHVPRLAQFIDWVDARLPCPPIEKQHEWLERARAREVLALPGLLATLTAVGFRDAEYRAEQLIPWVDPRISTGLLAMFAAPRYRANGAQWFYERCFKALTAQRDPRVPPALKALAARMPEIVTNSYGPELAKKLREVAAAMEVDSADEGSLKAPLDALEPFFVSERSDAERAVGKKAQLTAQEAELRARALAHPEDDGHFLVWADVLTEQGDPRGELMSLQLFEKKAALSPEQLLQLRALQSKHRDRLLGPLSSIVVNAVFERGVAVHVELRTNRTDGIPESAWAGVRGVTLSATEGHDFPAPLNTLPGLRSAMRIEADTLEVLAQRRGSLEHALLHARFNATDTLDAPVRHLGARDVRFAELLAKHEGASVTLEASPDDAVRALEKARSKVLRFVDGVHLLEPFGWYGWCLEFDTVSRALTVRGRFGVDVEPDFTKLDTWLAACARLKPSSTHFDDSPQRDPLYLPLRKIDFRRSTTAVE